MATNNSNFCGWKTDFGMGDEKLTISTETCKNDTTRMN